MMELYIFDQNLVFIGLLDTFTSLQWNRRYSTCGGFELHCAQDAAAVALLQKGRVIWKKGDPEAGHIEFCQLGSDAEGKEVIVIKGGFLSGYLGRRIIWGREILRATAEAAMRTLVVNHAIAPSDPTRAIPDIILGDLQGFAPMVSYQTSYSNLQDEIENLCNLSSLGYRITFDLMNRQLRFDVYSGLDRTSGQSVNPRAIFSQDFENVLAQEYTDCLSNYRNTALVGGMGEGTDRRLVTIGTAAGLDRFEVWDDAKDLTNVINEVTLTDTEYLATLVDHGNTKLTELQEVQTFDSTINLQSNLKYKTDFDLGDIVTVVSKKWGLILDTRITEISEIYEESGVRVEVTFGNSIPTLTSMIRKKLK